MKTGFIFAVGALAVKSKSCFNSCLCYEWISNRVCIQIESPFQHIRVKTGIMLQYRLRLILISELKRGYKLRLIFISESKYKTGIVFVSEYKLCLIFMSELKALFVAHIRVKRFNSDMNIKGG